MVLVGKGVFKQFRQTNRLLQKDPHLRFVLDHFTNTILGIVEYSRYNSNYCLTTILLGTSLSLISLKVFLEKLLQ